MPLNARHNPTDHAGVAAILLIVSTQTWWAMFELRDRREWEFAHFLVLLAQTVTLYLLAGLVFSDFPEDKAVDLRDHYFAQRRRFFAFLFVVVLAMIGFISAREWLHKALTIVTVSAVVLYVTLLFARLR